MRSTRIIRIARWWVIVTAYVFARATLDPHWSWHRWFVSVGWAYLGWFGALAVLYAVRRVVASRESRNGSEHA